MLRAGDAARAERLFRRVLREAAGRAEAQLGLADALVALDRRGEAIAALRRALAQLRGRCRRWPSDCGS